MILKEFLERHLFPLTEYGIESARRVFGHAVDRLKRELRLCFELLRRGLSAHKLCILVLGTLPFAE